jgi:hypothetical protein
MKPLRQPGSRCLFHDWAAAKANNMQNTRDEDYDNRFRAGVKLQLLENSVASGPSFQRERHHYVNRYRAEMWLNHIRSERGPDSHSRSTRSAKNDDRVSRIRDSQRS